MDLKFKEAARGNGVCDNCERRAETVIHFTFPLPYGGTHHLFKLCRKCANEIANLMQTAWDKEQ